MGDRSNLQFRPKDPKETIGIYGHWAGEEVAKAAMDVLNNPAFRKRVGDAHYATRIGVQTALESLQASKAEDTGFGLYVGVDVPDNDGYGVVAINVEDGSVSVEGVSIADPTEEAIRTAMHEYKHQRGA